MLEQHPHQTLINYFAYGSNMNPKRMIQRGVIFYSRRRLVVPGYDLKFNKTHSKHPNAGAANIVSNDEAQVEGVLYKITLHGLYNLDKFEGYPTEYERVSLPLDLGSGKLQRIITYIAAHNKAKDGLLPREGYLEHLLAARDILSAEYYNKLKSTQTL